MRIRSYHRPIVALVSFAALAAASPAAATHGGAHPTFGKRDVWFHCAGPTKLQNVNWFTNGASPWSATPPAQSVQQGAGCGAVEPGAYRNNATAPDNPYDPSFKGTFTGNLRDMTVRIHNLVLSQARQATTFPVRVRLLIDGQELLTNAGRNAVVTPVKSATGATELFEFSITNLGSAKEVRDAQGNLVRVDTEGLATEDGDGVTEHEVILVVDSVDATRSSGWVWDATEVPSGITFNPPTLAAAKIVSDLPQPPTEE